MAIPPVTAPATVRSALQRASEATGADFSLLVETARRESSFNATARAPTSSATGLFQFVDQTWLDVVRRHGAEHGLGDVAAKIRVSNGRAQIDDPKTRAAVLALRNDPEVSARMAGELAQEHAAILHSRLGRAPTNGEIYAAHVLGAGGAVKLIEAAGAGAADASTLFPEAARANPWLFNANGAPRSAEALLARFNMAGEGAAAKETAPATVALAPAGDSARLAALIDSMFHDLLQDWLSQPTQDASPFSEMLKAHAAYVKAPQV